MQLRLMDEVMDLGPRGVALLCAAEDAGALDQPELSSTQPEPPSDHPEPSSTQPEPSSIHPEPSSTQPEPSSYQPPSSTQPELSIQPISSEKAKGSTLPSLHPSVLCPPARFCSQSDSWVCSWEEDRS